jgi:hypothetical protein
MVPFSKKKKKEKENGMRMTPSKTLLFFKFSFACATFPHIDTDIQFKSINSLSGLLKAKLIFLMISRSP